MLRSALLTIALLLLSASPAESMRLRRTPAEQAELHAEIMVCHDIRAKIIKAAHLKESELYSRQLNACEKLVSMFGTGHLWCNLVLKPDGQIADLSIDGRAKAKSPTLNSKALDLIRAAGPFAPVKAKKLCYFIDLPLLLFNPGPDTDKQFQ